MTSFDRQKIPASGVLDYGLKALFLYARGFYIRLILELLRTFHSSTLRFSPRPWIQRFGHIFCLKTWIFLWYFPTVLRTLRAMIPPNLPLPSVFFIPPPTLTLNASDPRGFSVPVKFLGSLLEVTYKKPTPKSDLKNWPKKVTLAQSDHDPTGFYVPWPVGGGG